MDGDLAEDHASARETLAGLLLQRKVGADVAGAADSVGNEVVDLDVEDISVETHNLNDELMAEEQFFLFFCLACCQCTYFFVARNVGRKGISLPEQIKHLSDDLRRWYAANPSAYRIQSMLSLDRLQASAGIPKPKGKAPAS